MTYPIRFYEVDAAAYHLDFSQDIPLNNGGYQGADATVSDPQLRVTGQKDTANNRAHLWVQNKNHTWRNVVDGVAGISGLSGSVEISGFTPNTAFPVEWHQFTTQGIPVILNSTVSSDASGVISLGLPTAPDITDLGVKIGG